MVKAHLAFAIALESALVSACVTQRAPTTPSLVSPPVASGLPLVIAEPTASPPAALTGPLVSTKIRQAYQGARYYSAHFDEQRSAKASKQKQTFSGNVIFSTPDKMRWDYDVPVGNIVVAESVSALFTYSAGAPKAYKQSSFGSTAWLALAFLRGSLTADFDPVLVEPRSSGFSGHLVDCIPKLTSTITHVFLYVDLDTSKVLRVVIVDANGDQTRFDFTKARVDVTPAEASRFQWSPPSGVTIVDK